MVQICPMLWCSKLIGIAKQPAMCVTYHRDKLSTVNQSKLQKSLQTQQTSNTTTNPSKDHHKNNQDLYKPTKKTTWTPQKPDSTEGSKVAPNDRPLRHQKWRRRLRVAWVPKKSTSLAGRFCEPLGVIFCIFCLGGCLLFGRGLILGNNIFLFPLKLFVFF